MAMRALSRFVVRHRLLVAVFWLVVFVAGAATASKVSGRLSQDFSTPSAPSYPVNQAILRAYGSGGDGYPEAVLITVPAGATLDDPATTRALQRALGAVAAQPGLRVLSYLNTGDQRLVATDRRTTLALVFSPHHSEIATTDVGAQVTRTLTALLPAGTTVQTTGLTELSAGGSSGQGPGVLTETLLGALGALAVLAFVFGSLLALLPLLVAGVSILATFLVLLGLTTLTQVNFIVQFLVALIGLGVAIDYSLLLVTRRREEHAHGHTGPEAVHRAMATAGRAIVFSGLTVAVGLIALVFLPVPFLRSIGYGGMLIPLVSVGVALTLLPALLTSIGPRIDWPHRRREASAGRGWTAWACGVIRYRWAATLAAAAILATLGLAATGIQVGEPQADALAGSAGHGGPPVTALRALEHDGLPTGVLSPIEILITPGSDPTQVANRLQQIPGVYSALAPTDPGWRHGSTALVEVLPTAETSTPTGAATLARIRDTAAHLTGVSVGGAGATVVDETHAFYQRFPLMLAAITLVTLILLARAFRSLLLPVKAVVLNLASVGATYGVLVLVWQPGYGSHPIWGIPATAAHHQLGTTDDLRVPVRSVHGLRSVHPRPDSGNLRPHRLHPDRHHRRHRPHRPPDHQRRPLDRSHSSCSAHSQPSPPDPKQTSKLWPPAWAPESCWMPPSSAPCSSPP
jgi:RND superfamily putative drug exporter